MAIIEIVPPIFIDKLHKEKFPSAFYTTQGSINEDSKAQWYCTNQGIINTLHKENITIAAVWLGTLACIQACEALMQNCALFKANLMQQ
jgi:hypothetical protein